MRKYCCHICGSEMISVVENHVYHFQGKEIIVEDVSSYKCPICGEHIISSSEAKQIEEILRNS